MTMTNYSTRFISKNIESLSLGQENEISKLIEELQKQKMLWSLLKAHLSLIL